MRCGDNVGWDDSNDKYDVDDDECTDDDDVGLRPYLASAASKCCKHVCVCVCV